MRSEARSAEQPRTLQPDLAREGFARSVIRGLSDRPRWLSCRYLYDREGSEIFERITETPEYYPTRTEDGILRREAARIHSLCGADTLVELGAGSATKTRHLLRAWSARDRTVRYVPIDISRAMLAETSRTLRREFPALSVHPLAGSYEQALPSLCEFSPLTLLFLGSSVGNLNATELDEFFTALAGSLAAGDELLLGIDLVKDTRTLEAAYNDAAGWSSAFTLNLLARMNRELGTDIDMDRVEHVASWNQEKSRIDIFARFLAPATVELPEWGREFRIEAGERVLVEISRKFRAPEMIQVAAAHGFDHVETFADDSNLFALLLLRRRAAGDAREANRRRLQRELEEQRLHTLDRIAPLHGEQLARQHCPILSPVIWDLGHIASYETEWIARAACAEPAVDPAATEQAAQAAAASDSSLYDPIRHPRSVRGSLPLADIDACAKMLAATRDISRRLLDRTQFPDHAELLRAGYVFSMVAQHEAQHRETILQSVQLLPSLRYEPALREEPRSPDHSVERGDEIFIPAGPFTMGTDDRSVAYDNERPAHLVDLPSYWIDTTPVTNAVYQRFVDDGGYRRRELWTAAGWRWLGETRAEHPAQWMRAADGSWQERAFGRVAALEAARPVVHVCWHEATACAAWLGRRLPNEAEWEKAAAWDLERGVPRRYPWGGAAPSAELANLEQRTFAPAAAGAYPAGASYFGCEQMLGDVWEWTSSDFLPYPGFEAFPYREYSQVHFGDRHKVLRGGSWATAAIAIRNTFRNWDLPQRRQIFAGFRCARD